MPSWTFHGHPGEAAETKAKAEAHAADLRGKGFHGVKVVRHKTMGARGGPSYTVKWKSVDNPRRVRSSVSSPYRMRRADGEWRIFRMVPAYGFHPANVKRTGIEEFYGIAERRKDAADIVRELNSKRNPRRVRSNSTTLRNLASVKITRHRDGTVGIVARRNAPTKNRGGLKKAQRVVRRAARSGGKNPSDRTEGYVVYPDGYRFWSLGEANKEAKAESKDGASRIEGVYSEHVISRWRYGKKEQANRGRKR